MTDNGDPIYGSQFASTATFSTIQWTEKDQKNALAQDRRRKTLQTKKLEKALAYKSISDKYEVWKEYCIFSNYDEWTIEVEFPKFLKNYKAEIRKLIKNL